MSAYIAFLLGIATGFVLCLCYAAWRLDGPHKEEFIKRWLE